MTDENAIAVLDTRELLALMPEIATVVEQDSAAAQMDIARKILESQTLDEALADAEAEGALTVLDVPIRFHGFKLRASDMEGEGPPVFAIIDATRLDTGERVTLTTGALNVLAQLIFAGRGAHFPFDGQFRQSRKSKPGRTAPYRIVRNTDANGSRVVHKQLD